MVCHECSKTFSKWKDGPFCKRDGLWRCVTCHNEHVSRLIERSDRFFFKKAKSKK